MYGLNIDPGNPAGNPATAELRNLGVEQVRFTYRDQTTGDQLDPTQSRLYTQRIENLHRAEIGTLVILSYETYPNKPNPDAPDAQWDGYIDHFVRRAGQIARLLAPWRPALQIWNEPDLPPHPGYDPTLREAVFGRMIVRAVDAIKAVDPNLLVIGAGLASGQPSWLGTVVQSVGGTLPLDAIAIHPYGKRPEPNWPEPNWGFGYVGDLIAGYQQQGSWPIWITEIGTRHLSGQTEAEYLRRFYNRMTDTFSDVVKEVFWFCYSDGMVVPYGLLDGSGHPKLTYQAYSDVTPALPPLEGVSSDLLTQLHSFARYFEQRLVFGERDSAIEDQMLHSLRGNTEKLSLSQIREISEHLLAGSAFVVTTPEIKALHELQDTKDLYDMLKAIIMTAHQRTGALTGRLGVHTRVAAEDDHNVQVNIEAVLRIVERVQPGNRVIVMDMVKAVPDYDKLLAPDVFETDTYGYHRNGLIDNHAWNLQKLVRAIRDRGHQDRVLLIMRIDGPDDGASVNIFDADSRQKYQLAIAKFTRYLETSLPDTPFKIVLGNEPDLPWERPWSDPNIDARLFTLDQYAPAIGSYMKEIASQRPDVTLIAPALSALIKHDNLPYFQALFGDDRPENFIPSIHGYAGDVDALAGDQKNFIEQEVEKLRVAGFRHISGTEIGSSNPFASALWLNDHGRFDDVVIWLMLSIDYREIPGQNYHWNFRIDHTADDPTTRYLADIVNATKSIVLRNIRAWGGSGLQIMQVHSTALPAYAVDYLAHNTPPTAVVGQTNAVQVTVRNGSYRTWSAGGANPFRLGYHWYDSEGREIDPALWDDNRTRLPYDLAPGQTVSLNCNLSIPRATGAYQVRWDMVEEMVTWFAWQGVPTLTVPVTVNSEQVEPPPPTGLNVKASHNNRAEGRDNLARAIDGNIYTRWSSLQPQQPGMWFQIDLGEAQAVNRVQLNSENSPRDYPRGYIVTLSTDEANWQRVAEKQNNDGPLDVAFAPQQARYVRVEQTGSDSVYWWSIHDINISAESQPTLTTSHNNVIVGADNVGQALDGRANTRWSSRSGQRPGMWVEINLNEVRSVNGLTLDNANSPQDYPRGYVVKTSMDRNVWEEVARKDQNEQGLDVTFPTRQARYIRVEQTGQSAQWWWSINEITVWSDREMPAARITVQSSHHNVTEGGDNVLHALDGRADTRWSSHASQQPGMWFEFDLNTVKQVKRVVLDSATSSQDYPRGYVVKVSLDRSQWTEVARRDENDKSLVDVTFTPRQARYIRVEQTGRAERWWWSIHRTAIGFVD